MIDLYQAFKRQDPALRSFLEFLLYPGVWALGIYRVSHFFYQLKFYLLARLISQWARFITGIEIHPGAQIGKRLVIDHGMGVVIGETTIIGDDCLLYHGVTLGGTGKLKCKRHPTLKDKVVVGAQASVLGNITLGEGAMIGANAVVLHDVLPNTTVVGVPAHPAEKK